jgi:hypothetical protein
LLSLVAFDLSATVLEVQAYWLAGPQKSPVRPIPALADKSEPFGRQASIIKPNILSPAKF